MTARTQYSFDVATVTLNPAIDRTIAVNHFATGAVNRAELVGEHPGGKGVNVAASLAAQGLRVAAFGFLGRDNADIFSTFFDSLKIHDEFIRLPGATRTGIKIVDAARGETTDLNFPGLPPSPADLGALALRLDGLDTRWCALAGSLPPGVPSSWYANTIARLKARGVRVAVDTSGEALRKAAAAAPDILKPNLHELSALAGRELRDEASIVATARDLIRDGVRLVAVSCGADGAFFVSADEVVRAVPPAITVGSTVGAGDAMVAGILAARLRDLSLVETARMATAFSLRALTRDAPTGRPRASMDEFAARVGINHGGLSSG